MSSSHSFKNVKREQLAVKGHVRKAFWNRREIVKGTSHGEANQTSCAALKLGA